MTEPRRFPPPWEVDEATESFCIRDAKGRRSLRARMTDLLAQIPDGAMAIIFIGLLIKSCFIVRDANGLAVAQVYYEEEKGRRTAANLMTKDEARRIPGQYRQSWPNWCRAVRDLHEMCGA
jgi:hypothetical protein